MGRFEESFGEPGGEPFRAREGSALWRLERLLDQRIQNQGGDPSPEWVSRIRAALGAAMSSWAMERGEESVAGFATWAFDLDGARAWREAREREGLPAPREQAEYWQSLPGFGWWRDWTLSAREHHGYACSMLFGGLAQSRLAELMSDLDEGSRRELADQGVELLSWPESEAEACERLAAARERLETIAERRALEEAAGGGRAGGRAFQI